VNLIALLALGFFLGMRHATDADHVVAVTTIVSRKRTLAAALPVGALWGLGHTLTIVLVGGAMILFGVVISPRLGLGMELSVAIMLVVLGAMNVWAFVRDVPALAHDGPDRHGKGHGHGDAGTVPGFASLRPLLVGVVHGLAGSASVALLVLGTIHEAAWALAYLLVFCIGTIAGMAVITAALAVPVVATAERFARIHRALGVATGVASLAFGAAIAYQVGFVHGLFTGHPDWTPQ
jgi:high-affinity nickel-transport protein